MRNGVANLPSFAWMPFSQCWNIASFGTSNSQRTGPLSPKWDDAFGAQVLRILRDSDLVVLVEACTTKVVCLHNEMYVNAQYCTYAAEVIFVT